MTISKEMVEKEFKNYISKRYNSIKARCNCKSATGYYRYGALGIKLELTKDEFYKWFTGNVKDIESARKLHVDRINSKDNYKLDNIQLIDSKSHCKKTYNESESIKAASLKNLKKINLKNRRFNLNDIIAIFYENIINHKLALDISNIYNIQNNSIYQILKCESYKDIGKIVKAAIEFVNREMGKRKCENCIYLVEDKFSGNYYCYDLAMVPTEDFYCSNFEQSEPADGGNK
jgi:uncharacterized protein (UPF0212 family)